MTGITGFLGSHLAHALIAEGYKVIGLKRRSSSLHRLSGVLNALTLVDIESVDYDAIFRDHGKVDTIVHTATSYGRNNETVTEIFSANTEFPLSSSTNHASHIALGGRASIPSRDPVA